MQDKLAIVLNGGGARASYQAGALRALYEIIKKDQNLFNIITGNSAGAINASFLASNARDWGGATQYLSDFWQRIYPEDVFDMGHFTMTKIGTNWLKDTLFKSNPEGVLYNSVLNTAPLKKLLTREIDFSEIRSLVQSKLLSSIALSATNYYSGASVVFPSGQNQTDSPSRKKSLLITYSGHRPFHFFFHRQKSEKVTMATDVYVSPPPFLLLFISVQPKSSPSVLEMHIRPKTS